MNRLSLRILSVRVVAGLAVRDLSYTRSDGTQWMIFSRRNERQKSRHTIETRLIHRILTTKSKSKSLTRTTRKRKAAKKRAAKTKSSHKPLIVHRVLDVGVHRGSCRTGTFLTVTEGLSSSIANRGFRSFTALLTIWNQISSGL